MNLPNISHKYLDHSGIPNFFIIINKKLFSNSKIYFYNNSDRLLIDHLSIIARNHPKYFKMIIQKYYRGKKL